MLHLPSSRNLPAIYTCYINAACTPGEYIVNNVGIRIWPWISSQPTWRYYRSVSDLITELLLCQYQRFECGGFRESEQGLSSSAIVCLHSVTWAMSDWITVQLSRG